jgi:tetratricopeptide (TPR) repeat protein
MIEEQPLVGIGLGNWKIESIPYEKAFADDHSISNNTHNDFIELSAETGVVNGIIYMSIFILCIYSNLKTILRSEDLQTRTISLLALLLIISYGVDALFNFPLYRPTMQLGFGFLMALTIVNTAGRNESSPNLLNIWLSIFVILISIFTSYFSLQTFKAYRLENDIKANFLLNKFTLTTNEIIYKLPKYPNVFTTGEPFTTYVGKYFIEEGNFNQANRYLNIGNAINPYIGRTEFYKSIIAEKTGKKDSAFIYAKEALEVRPRNKTYYIAAINSAIVLKDTKRILEVHNLYVQYKNHPEIWINTSSALNQSNYKIKRLVEFVDKGLIDFPNDSLLLERKKLFEDNSIKEKSQPFVVQATTFFNSKKYGNAIGEYKKALNVDPQNYILLENIGLCYYNLNKYFDAISYFKRSLISPNAKDGKSQYFLGMSYFFIKDKENGCKYLNFAKDKSYGNAQEIIRQTCN